MTNIAALLQTHLACAPKPLYTQWDGSAWRDYTQHDIASLAARWQRAFRAQGIVKGERVAICARNGVNWVAFDQAALGLGLVVVPIYVDDNAESAAWCLQNCTARLVFLENSRLLAGIVQAMETPPVIVCASVDAVAPALFLDTWLAESGASFEAVDLEAGTLATLVYTSGTTGRPKGVMLSHGNIVSNVEAVTQAIQAGEDDVFISVLPVSHMFERTGGYYLPLLLGARVVFARGVNQLAEDLLTHRPTIIIAVPRLFERFMARIEHALANKPIDLKLYRLAVQSGWRRFQRRSNLFDRLLGGILRHKVGGKVLARFGGRVRLALVGGAALDQRIAQTFIGLGLTLLQGYGLTETSPVISVNREQDNDPNSVGTALPGIEIRVNAARELLGRGSGVMQGYWQNPQATQAVLDAQGWFNTGDTVEIRDGRIYIKGRTKDILVLSNGEKCPPAEVEQAILCDPVFQQVMLLGEARPFLALLAVSAESDEKKLVRLANARLAGFPRFVRIHRVIAVNEAWTLENGLLTPTLKVKRRAVHERYRELIERAYSTGPD
ncbi:MAG: AMP-dependent synthetase/ligase [Burkholderiales bacterium]